MKIYTNVFDLARICQRRFWVAPYSDFKIGVKIAEKGVPSAKDFVVKAGLTELIPDDDKVDGFTTYTIKSADTGFVEYTIEVEGVSEKLKLVQITTDSTVFEVGGSGGGDVPADVATKSWVNSQISDFVDEDALTAYATKGELTSFYTKSETSSATEIQTALDGKQPTGDYALTSQIPVVNDATLKIYQDGQVKGTFTANSGTDVSVFLSGGGADMSNYYTKSETSSATELSGEFNAVSARADSAYNLADSANEQLGGKVDHKAGGTAPEVMNITTYYESEYAQLSVDDPNWKPDPSTMYVILKD